MEVMAVFACDVVKSSSGENVNVECRDRLQ
jgi:hypothetical protein